MINALLSIQTSQYELFFDNWRFDADGNRLRTDFAPYQTSPDTPLIDVYDRNDCIVEFVQKDLWRENIENVPPKTLVSIYVADKVEPDWTDPQDPDPKDILTVVHYIREVAPCAIVVVDCFKADGIRHGQELDEDGVTIIGQPTYPSLSKVQMLGYMPDDVVYDADGNEVSRTPATDYKEVNKLLGWADRRYE